MDQPTTSTTRKRTMIVIIATILFPLILVAFIHIQNFLAKNDSPTVDPAQFEGYEYFATWGVEIQPDSDAEFYNAVYAYAGIPHKSKAPGRGLDCSMLVKKVFEDAWQIELKGSSRDLYRSAIPISESELDEGDLVFFKIGSDRINHVGIYLNDGKFIHVSTEKGVVINDLSEEYYRSRYYKAARIER